nr:linear amide C-N hydrolase [uncultured Chitinophaga sp.]
MKLTFKTLALTIIASLAAITIIYPGRACTRVVYKGLDGLYLTARSMDWKEDTQTDLWIFPRGMARNGETGAQTVKWKSKYGSVVAAAYNICSTDGMNEKGLVANLLWLAESKYPQWDRQKPGLTIAAWVQYVLDNFATVKEAVDELQQERFTIVSDNVPGQSRLATLHLSISDPSGDNAIFEYIEGKLVIHHDTAYQVMTNSPVFDKQLALNEYWKEIGGTTMLPGTNRAADRFVRASFYTTAIPKTKDSRLAAASVFSVIRNCSVPYGISTPDQPNISSTRWRTVSDQKNLVYYFESALAPNTFWVDLKDVNFSPRGGVKKLSLTKGEIYAGDVSGSFKRTNPFKFLGPQ